VGNLDQRGARRVSRSADQLAGRGTHGADPHARRLEDLGHSLVVTHASLVIVYFVYKIYLGYWYWGRPIPEELRQDFRVLTRNCRPDWDLSARALREAWERGERRRFFPYPTG
jgi:hypothetical protein